MYCQGLGLEVIGRFENHDGFDGVMLGRAGASYHLEFTSHRTAPVVPSPTAEDLLVLYVPEQDEWTHMCNSMVSAGFKATSPHNPYWGIRGRTFVDGDGYRTVVERAAWVR